jgi:general secretion pathway protein B
MAAAPPASELAAATAAANPPIAPEETVPRLASLPASDRAQLPPLKLSMHVYAEDPTQRFVILDGKRLQEGASPASGVVIEQIRRDGLVLSVNGRRVLLARP